MAFIAMSTNNPLGHRPYGEMGLAGAFDFPGAPVPDRVPPELLQGVPAMSAAIHPPAIVAGASPWDADEPVMLLGMGDATSTQTAVPTSDTTPQTTGAIASGAPVWSAWFGAPSTIIPGLKNWELLTGAAALTALMMSLGRR